MLLSLTWLPYLLLAALFILLVCIAARNPDHGHPRVVTVTWLTRGTPKRFNLNTRARPRQTGAYTLRKI